jgi:hypothetical protein
LDRAVTLMSKLTVRVTAFRPLRRNTLVGFATVYVSEMHLCIHDVAVHRHAGGAHWVQLPAKPLLDRDGNLRRTGAGKIEYAKVLNFDSRTIADAFGDAVIEALLEFNPTVFDESAA